MAYSMSSYLSCKVISDVEKRKYKNKEGAVDHFYQCFIYTGMNRICSLSFSENQKDRIKLDKCYKFRVYPRGVGNFRLDGNAKIFYIRECDTGIDSIQMDLALNPEPLSVSTALKQPNGELISIVGVVHTVSSKVTDPIDTECSIRQVITLEDELEEDARIKVKFWGCKFIPFHSSVSEKVRINLVNIEVYGSIVSCVSSVLSNVQEDDTKMISNLVVEAVDTDTSCVLFQGGKMYEITKPDMEKIYDFERDEMKSVLGVKIMTEGRKIVQLDLIEEI
ncbi:uncharacterized protein LOC143051117 isoform X1 [Mytilus galloprovincialis]|uniref:uncharacterized protein LOC143051117 isoform X1 n=1 Tax=Mytilus galloprovincialis TaxID=29158 RepID=UPI003F7C6791